MYEVNIRGVISLVISFKCVIFVVFPKYFYRTFMLKFTISYTYCMISLFYLIPTCILRNTKNVIIVTFRRAMETYIII